MIYNLLDPQKIISFKDLYNGLLFFSSKDFRIPLTSLAVTIKHTFTLLPIICIYRNILMYTFIVLKFPKYIIHKCVSVPGQISGKLLILHY